MYIYTVEYLNNKYNRIRDYIIAKDEEECMSKFNMHHTNTNGFIVNWQKIDY